MKKIKNKLFFLILSVFLTVSFLFMLLPKNRNVFASTETNSEEAAERIHCTATLEDDFTEDSVIELR